MTPQLSTICDELGVSVIPISKYHRYRGPLETCAVNTLERILREHGPEHLRSTLIAIVETGKNKRQLVAPILLGVSDLLLAHPHWFGSAFLDAMDKIDLAAVHERAKANRKAAQPRQAIATMLFDRLRPVFEMEKV